MLLLVELSSTLQVGMRLVAFQLLPRRRDLLVKLLESVFIPDHLFPILSLLFGRAPDTLAVASLVSASSPCLLVLLRSLELGPRPLSDGSLDDLGVGVYSGDDVLLLFDDGCFAEHCQVLVL